jgi:hypothetical protein
MRIMRAIMSVSKSEVRRLSTTPEGKELLWGRRSEQWW